MVLPGTVVSRFVYEISADCGLPSRIFACAMMLYHAFMEYVSEEDSLQDPDCLMVGITSVVLSLKFNENYLNTIEMNQDPIPAKSRSMRVIDSAARAIVSYGSAQSSSQPLTTEQLVLVKERVKLAVSEMSMLRIFGNFATCVPVIPETDKMTPVELVGEYSTPQCLCHWSSKILS